MLRLAPGQSGTAVVDANGKKGGEVRFSLRDVPGAPTAWLDTGLQMLQPDRTAQDFVSIDVTPSAQPGRYFAGIEATYAG